MAVLTLGTGVGGGVVVFGKLSARHRWHGAGTRPTSRSSATAGPAVRRHRLPGRLCLGQGMVRTALERAETGKARSSARCVGNDSHNSPENDLRAAQRATKWRMGFEETATWLGLGIASIGHYQQNPERVILCGGMIAAGDLLFGPCGARFSKTL